MAKLYAQAVLAGTKAFSEVTSLYKPQVRAILESKVLTGELSPEKFAQLVGE